MFKDVKKLRLEENIARVSRFNTMECGKMEKNDDEKISIKNLLNPLTV